jgi:hypothetical protein
MHDVVEDVVTTEDVVGVRALTVDEEAVVGDGMVCG